MENASKSLIIAGAILLSILLITLGIIVYRQASGVIDNNAMDETAVSTFNEKFQQYEGTNVRGTQVNSLLSTIAQNNLSNSNDTSKQVSVTVSATNWQSGTKPSGTITAVSAKASTGKSYNVTCASDLQSGYITTITISDAQ